MKQGLKIFVAAALALAASSCTKDDFLFIPTGGVARPQGQREASPAVNYRNVVLYYGAGYNNLCADMSINIDSLCVSGLPQKGDTDNIVLSFTHFASSATDYVTPTAPVLVRLYKSLGEVCRDTVAVFPTTYMGASAGVFTEVLNLVRNRYRADNYGLIISSHGGGWVPESYNPSAEGGIFPDAASVRMAARPHRPESDWDRDCGFTKFITVQYDGIRYKTSITTTSTMEIDEFAAAIPMHLSYIIFDACLMGGVETIYELKDKCSRIAASPSEIWQYGLVYESLCRHLLNEDGPDLEGVCSDYYESYNRKRKSASIALFDCSAVAALADSCKAVFANHRDDIDLLAKSGNPVRGIEYSYMYGASIFYDFKAVMTAIGASGDEMESLQKALDACIEYKAATETLFNNRGVTPELYSGVSMFFPDATRPNLKTAYKETSWNRYTGLVK